MARALQLRVLVVALVAMCAAFGLVQRFTDGSLAARGAPLMQRQTLDGVTLDASVENIEYFMTLWNLHLQSIVPSYEPGAHGITQSKYKGHKVRFLYAEMALAKAEGLQVRNICEVGMYAGNSGNFWLLAYEHAHLYTFDKFKGSANEKLGLAAASMLTKLGRTTFIRGQSGTTVPQFAKEHPGVRCDLVFIDGSKAFDQRVADLTNFRALSHPKTLVLMDDIASEACLKGGGVCETVDTHTNYNTAQAAYRHKVDKGELIVQRCLQDSIIPDFPPDDIVCVGRFLY